MLLPHHLRQDDGVHTGRTCLTAQTRIKSSESSRPSRSSFPSSIANTNIDSIVVSPFYSPILVYRISFCIGWTSVCYHPYASGLERGNAAQATWPTPRPSKASSQPSRTSASNMEAHLLHLLSQRLLMALTRNSGSDTLHSLASIETVPSQAAITRCIPGQFHGSTSFAMSQRVISAPVVWAFGCRVLFMVIHSIDSSR